jgi:KipI family sensor histidine kinase inhibitor
LEYEIPKILPCGDQAVSIEFGDSIDPNINRKVLHLLGRFRVRPVPGIKDLIPSYRSLLIQYDPLKLSTEDLKTFLRLELPCLGQVISPKGKIVTIPVHYGGSCGPDLQEVAEYHGLTPAEVIALHSAVTYRVYMIGFSPGFPFLGGLDPRLHTPRKKSPREKVPAGSVGIADQQTGIYSLDSPGGWRLIGRTPLKLFDLSREEPLLLGAGDQVLFQPITGKEIENY